MSTPAEQLKTINENLAEATAAGDTARIANLQKSKSMTEALIDANSGKTTSATTQTADGGYTTTFNDGSKVVYNSKGEQVSEIDAPTSTTQTTTEPYSVVSQGGIVVSASKAAQDAGVVVGQATPVSDAVITPGGEVEITPSNTLSAPPVGNVGSQPPVVPVVVTSKPEQTVTTESTAQTAKTENAADQKTVTSADDSNHGTPYDEEGNLNNGWSKNEDGDAVWVGAGYNDATGQTAARTNTIQSNTNEFVGPMPTANQSTLATASAIPDWRVKLSLAKSATSYLYGAAKPGDILYPLKLTGGVVFPYTPQIQTSYKASYDSSDLTHSNYKMHFYKNSSVEDIQITCDFTAQDSEEASYVLAVIHFFKSVTKMFYGKDTAPSAGTPPPLVYLSGYGQYQFNNHPMLVSSFSYNLPNEVDYIRASTGSSLSLSAGAAVSASNAAYVPGLDFIKSRLLGANLNKGGATSQPSFTLKAAAEPTYVPTKIQIQLTCLPVVTRNDISNEFSLREYAAGNLFNRNSGGIW